MFADRKEGKIKRKESRLEGKFQETKNSARIEYQRYGRCLQVGKREE